MRFKDFLEAGEMGSRALGMSPSAINPASGGAGRFPTMPTGKDGTVEATPLGQDQSKKISGGPFSVGRYVTGAPPRKPGISGAENSPKEKPVASPFGSNGATAPDKVRDAGTMGQLWKPKQLNLGPGTNNPDMKSPLPKAR